MICFVTFSAWDWKFIKEGMLSSFWSLKLWGVNPILLNDSLLVSTLFWGMFIGDKSRSAAKSTKALLLDDFWWLILFQSPSLRSSLSVLPKREGSLLMFMLCLQNVRNKRSMTLGLLVELENIGSRVHGWRISSQSIITWSRRIAGLSSINRHSQRWVISREFRNYRRLFWVHESAFLINYY